MNIHTTYDVKLDIFTKTIEHMLEHCYLQKFGNVNVTFLYFGDVIDMTRHQTKLLFGAELFNEWISSKNRKEVNSVTIEQLILKHLK